MAIGQPTRLFSIDQNETLLIWAEPRDLLHYVEPDDVLGDEYEIFDENGHCYQLVVRERHGLDKIRGAHLATDLKRGDRVVERAVSVIRRELLRLGHVDEADSLDRGRLNIAGSLDVLQAATA